MFVSLSLSLSSLHAMTLHGFQDLATQIKHYQTEVNEITERSRELALDSAHLSPKLFRKHYLPESAYDDYFSAAQIHHRVGSPLPASSPLFYDTLPTFELASPRTFAAAPTSNKDGKVKDVPASASSARRETSLPDGPAVSLDLPRKIPPPKKDTIPRPTWSDGTPNQTSPGKPAQATKSPGISRDKNVFFRQSETLDAPGESVSTSGYATAPSSARSVGAGAAPMLKRSDEALFSSSAGTESGPKLSLKHVDAKPEKTLKSFTETMNMDRVLDKGQASPTKMAPKRFSSSASAAAAREETVMARPVAASAVVTKTGGPQAMSPAASDVGPQSSKRQAALASALSPSLSRDTTSLDSGLDTGTNVSLTSSAPQRHGDASSSVSSVVERLAAAMAASAPTRPPPPGARPTELLRMGGSTENLTCLRPLTVSTMSSRSESADNLARQRLADSTSQSTPRGGSSSQDSFYSLQSSPRVFAPGESTSLATTATAEAPWKSVSESNLTTSARSPRFGDASATSTPRAAVAQVITGTAVFNTDSGTRNAWDDLDLDAGVHVKRTPREDMTSGRSEAPRVTRPPKDVPPPPDFSPPSSRSKTTQVSSPLALLPEGLESITSISAQNVKDPKSSPLPSAFTPKRPELNSSALSSSPKPKADQPYPLHPQVKGMVMDFKTPTPPLSNSTTTHTGPRSNFLLSISRPRDDSPRTQTSTVANKTKDFRSVPGEVTQSVSPPSDSPSRPVPQKRTSVTSAVSRLKSPSRDPSLTQSSQRVTSLSVTDDRTISVSAFSPLSVPRFASPPGPLTKSLADQTLSAKPAGTGTQTANPSASTPVALVRLGGAVGRDAAAKSGLTPLRSRGSVKLVGDGIASNH